MKTLNINSSGYVGNEPRGCSCGCENCNEEGAENMITKNDVVAMTRQMMQQGKVGNFISCTKDEAKKLAPLDMGEYLRATRRPEKRFGETPERLFNQSRESDPASMAPLDMGDYIRAQRGRAA